MFSPPQKVVLTHATKIAHKIADEMEKHGFADGSANLRKLLPLTDEERIGATIDLLQKVRAKLVDQTNSAGGITVEEVVIMSWASELFGVLEGQFLLPHVKPEGLLCRDLFPPEEDSFFNRLRLLDTDKN